MFRIYRYGVNNTPMLTGWTDCPHAALATAEEEHAYVSCDTAQEHEALAEAMGLKPGEYPPFEYAAPAIPF